MSLQPGDLVTLLGTPSNDIDHQFLMGLRGVIQKPHPKMRGWWMVSFPQRDYVAPLPGAELCKISAIDLLGDLVR